MSAYRNNNLRIARMVDNFGINNHINKQPLINIPFFNSEYYYNNRQKYHYPHNFTDGNVLLNDLTNSLNKVLSKSVFDLVNCFICLCPAQDPLTCPKCNNFGCRKCLETYFGNARRKPCPICKQYITLNELDQNIVIKEIEEILNKDNTKKEKSKELSELISKKKKNFENQFINSNNILERLIKYQDTLKRFREEYDYFLLQIKQISAQIFNDYNQKIEQVINSLLSFNKMADSSIQKYNNIYRNSKNNFYNNNNIKDLINDILSLERMKFNYNHNDTEQFLNASFNIIPYTYLYHMKEIILIAKEVRGNNHQRFIGNDPKIGDYKLSYTFESEELKCYCRLMFTLKDDIQKTCFLITQILKKFNKESVFPMKFVRQDNKTYTYECKITSEEMKNTYDFKLNTDIVVFSLL